MSRITKAQIERLTQKYRFNVDGNDCAYLPSDFDTVTFISNGAQVCNEIKVVFEDYFITGFPGFDFHEKFNNGVYPFDKVMYGKIVKETEKMYFFELHTETSDKKWCGWCPKKSCTIKNGG